MVLVVRWYDVICLGIVGVSLFVAVCVVLKRDCLIPSQQKKRRQQQQQQHEQVYWRSCWRGLHPGWILGLRVSSLSILSLFLLWDIHSYDASIFLYYTEWTFTLVIIYFAIGTIVSAHGCAMQYYSSSSDDSNNALLLVFDNEDDIEDDQHRIIILPPNGNGGNNKEAHYTMSTRPDEIISQRAAGFWCYLMQIAYQTCGGAVILTDIIFWCVIVPFLSNAHYELNMLMGCMHTLNAVLLLVDTSVNSLSFRWFRVAYFVVWSCCYVIFQWLIHACGFSWWPYPFLDLSTPWAPLWYFSLAVLHIPCYGLYFWLVTAKYSLFPRLFPRSFLTLLS